MPAKQAISYVEQAFQPAVSRVEEQADWKVCPTSVIALSSAPQENQERD
jgi:hypothetical protein